MPTHVLGLVVSPRTGSSYPGYERTNVNVPQLLARILTLATPRNVSGRMGGRGAGGHELRHAAARFSQVFGAACGRCASPGLAIAGRGKSAVSDGQ